MQGDLVRKKISESEETNSETISKEDLIELVADPTYYTIHDVLIPIPGYKVKVEE